MICINVMQTYNQIQIHISTTSIIILLLINVMYNYNQAQRHNGNISVIYIIT